MVPSPESIAEHISEVASTVGSSLEDKYRRAVTQLRTAFENGDIVPRDFIVIGEFVLAHDPDQYAFPGPDRSFATLQEYASKLTHVATGSPTPLVKMNAVMTGHDGQSPW